MKFIVDFQGQIGQKGEKGQLFSPVFFPLDARGDLACKSCASSQERSHYQIRPMIYLQTNFLCTNIRKKLCKNTIYN